MKKTFISFVLALLLLALSFTATAEEDQPQFSFHGALWGMSSEEVHRLMEIDPYQEVSSPDGRTGLIYAIQMEGFPCLAQYSFLPSGALYNIEIMSLGKGEGAAFYSVMAAQYTSRYGEPLTDAVNGTPVGAMIGMMMISSDDINYLGWQPDKETVIVLSYNEQFSTCYVEIRRYSDFFH